MIRLWLGVSMIRLWLGVAVSLIAATASAQQAQPEEVELEDAAARQMFQVATLHYQQGEFLDAAHEYEEAYRLSTRPELLYNAYVAYRDAGSESDAARTLRAYLESGSVDEERRPMLQARLETLEAELAPEGGESDASEASRPLPRGDGNVLASVVAPILFGLGGATILAAAITGGVATGMHGDLSDACTNGVCPADRQSDIDTLSALMTTTDVLWPIGVAAVAVGLVLVVVDLTNDSSDSPVRASCGPLGCTLTIRGIL